ncbi:MAG: YheU family protein [Gammaproteobacteria bacterium]|nr:YheU family protein [Gammaproteobacteria bacterium]
MQIPPEQLSADALRGIIEEFITREGTEYGARELPLATKVAEVEAQLRRGEVVIDFDPVTDTVDIRPRD